MKEDFGLSLVIEWEDLSLSQLCDLQGSWKPQFTSEFYL